VFRKTRIALEAVHRWKEFHSVFWVHAGTAQRIEKGYLDIAETVGIVGWDSQDPRIDKLRLVKDWLEKPTSGPWILILDNADDVDLLYGKRNNPTRLADYFPRSQNGAILLTTRNKQVASKFTNIQNILQIQAFDNTESVNLLKAKVGDHFDEHDYVKLARALDNVPLALVQAAAFVLEQSISISEYLHR
jgi:NB-ARC domain